MPHPSNTGELYGFAISPQAAIRARHGIAVNLHPCHAAAVAFDADRLATPSDGVPGNYGVIDVENIDATGRPAGAAKGNMIAGYRNTGNFRFSPEHIPLESERACVRIYIIQNLNPGLLVT